MLRKASRTAVDQWYWLRYRDVVRDLKVFPPHLPEYILDVAHWYPPFFGWLLSKVPDKLFTHPSFTTQFLSLCRISIIIALVCFLNTEAQLAVYLSILVYITAPILVYYDNQINSRILGAIIVDLLIVLWFGYFDYGFYISIIPIVILTTLLLFTHKMSQQLYVFLLLGLSIYYTDFVPAATLTVSVIIAILFFNYKMYFKPHIEIIKFWHRNKYKLGAHQFYESKIYASENFVYPNRLHGGGIKAFVKKAVLIIGMLPAMLFIAFNYEMNYFGIIIAITTLFILLTSFVPCFYCLGSGNLYTYNLVTFISFYFLITTVNYSSLFNQVLMAVVIVMTATSVLKYYAGIKAKANKGCIDEALDFLKASSLNRILVLPFQLPDEVAYKSSKSVFWGCHGYGFLLAEPYYPIFNRKIEDVISDWNLGAIFLRKDYFVEFIERVDMAKLYITFENEEYVVYAVNGWSDGEVTPQWAIEQYPDLIGKRIHA